MSAALKTAVVVLPFLVLFLMIRTCAEGEADRWRARAAAVDPEAVIGVEEDDLIVIAPSRDVAVRAADEVRDFRHAVVDEYGDLLGRPSQRRLVIVLFSTVDQLSRYAGEEMVHDPEYVQRIHGYTDSKYGAIFLPPETKPRTLRHETVHWIVDMAAGGARTNFTPWLSEGLAQLFEIYDPRAGVAPGIGPEDAGLVRLLIKGTLDVHRLVHLEDYRTFVVEDSARNYLEALVLTTFLFERRPREKLKQYLEVERRASVGRPAAFQTIYRYTEEPFRRDLARFLAEVRGE